MPFAIVGHIGQLDSQEAESSIRLQILYGCAQRQEEFLPAFLGSRCVDVKPFGLIEAEAEVQYIVK